MAAASLPELIKHLQDLQRPLFDRTEPFLSPVEWQLFSYHLDLPANHRSSYALLPRLTAWSFLHPKQSIVWLRLLLLHLGLGGTRSVVYAAPYAECFFAAYGDEARLAEALLSWFRKAKSILADDAARQGSPPCENRTLMCMQWATGSPAMLVVICRPFTLLAMRQATSLLTPYLR
jgi:hypothetical protein